MTELKVSFRNELDVANLELEYAAKGPEDILKFALEQFDNIAISFSGAEDVVLIDER